MTKLSVSVIVSTYNQPEVLELVIGSFKKQNYKNFELILADDGSDFRTRDLIQKESLNSPIPLIHVWHEDIGYRKTVIHNEAIRKSQGDLIIFIDGDCVVASDFVWDHVRIFLQYNHQDYLLMGRRVELGPKITNQINVCNVSEYLRPWSPALFLSCLKKDSQHFWRSFSIDNEIVRFILRSNNVSDLLGSNFSIPRKLLIKINGFNEDQKFYWGEDGDIFVRARNVGAKLIGKKSYAVQYHLYHTRREPKPDAEALYHELLKNIDYVYAKNGLVSSK